jgi:3-oxoadipate enol-lactonase
MPEANIGDISLYYEIHGEGYPLVLIRGLGSNADHWYSQLPSLSEKYRVITFDNRGIARSKDPRSENPGEALTVPLMAEDTLGLLNALDLDRPHIMGLSMGGMIAQELAISHPERVNGLVLACTHSGGPRQIRPTAEVEELFKEMVYVGSPQSKMDAAPVLFDPDTLAHRPECARKYAEISLKHPAGPEILTRQWMAVQAHDAWDRLPEIKAPTLVLTGDADVLIPPGNSEILAERIPNARLIVIPGGGHQILVEEADACNEAILTFLTSIKFKC